MCSAPFFFPRSIATVSLAGTLPEKLEAAASIGFDGVELFDNDLLTALRPKCGGSAASSVWRSQPFSRSGISRRCRACRYCGPLSLEVFNDEFRAAPVRLTARDGLRSLILAEAEAGGRELPDPPGFDGVEFVEFTVDEVSADDLAVFLGHLGFRRAGRHRLKAVDLFRQGRINLLLNSEPDSAASYHFQLHGPSVCALGLRVDDAQRALGRAKALKCSLWQEPIGAGERVISAVRAPDGMLINLIEPDSSGRTIYEDDFQVTAEPGSDAGLVAIDHIAQTLPVGRMEAAVLFWRAVFGFAPQRCGKSRIPTGWFAAAPW